MLDNPDDTAQLFYLLLLGMFVLVWLFSQYRGRLGQATQHAAIWVLIFLGGTMIFGFSDSLKSMLTGSARQINENTIVLNQGRGGHFRAKVEVNGVPVDFIVDTGATNLVLSRRDAERVGFEPENLTYVVPSMTANGQVMNARVNIDEMSIGAFTDRDVAALVNGGPLDVSLLGMTYLERYSGWRVEGDQMFLNR